ARKASSSYALSTSTRWRTHRRHTVIWKDARRRGSCCCCRSSLRCDVSDLRVHGVQGEKHGATKLCDRVCRRHGPCGEVLPRCGGTVVEISIARLERIFDWGYDPGPPPCCGEEPSRQS